MSVNKLTLYYISIYILLVIYIFIRFQGVYLGDIIVTTYDEIRYLNNSSLIINDINNYELSYILRNFYYYTDSVHFLHYFNLSFFRLFFGDSMMLWCLYQLNIYIIGVYFFSKFLVLEFDFVSDKDIPIIFILMLCYPVFHYLSFSLMRDISIFCFFSMSLYFFKKNKLFLMLLCVLILAFYRVNMLLCFFLYIGLDYMLKGKFKAINILKYIVGIFSVLFFIDMIIFNFIYRNIFRFFNVNIFDFFNEFMVFFLSPLPWSVSDAYPEYLKLWFVLSFMFSLLLIFYSFIKFIQRKNNSVSLPIFIAILVYIFTYSTEGGIGFRQSSIMLPFFYMPVFICFLKDINYKLAG